MAEEPDDSDETREGSARRLVGRLRAADRQPNLLKAAAAVRRMAPGDSELGRRVAAGDAKGSDLVARAMARSGSEEGSVTRELGLTAVQLWQSLAEAQGRGRGEVDVAILFTDLVEFSTWALDVGDETAIELLDDVGSRSEQAVDEHRGDVVKRLGDGLMAVFADADDAVRAAHAAMESVSKIECEGYDPQLRAGLHLGRPRKIGGDYLGVDVNVAARVADAASGGELLVSGTAMESLSDGFESRRKRRFKAKGAPKDLEVFSVRPAGSG
jgi:adenylate cyclase